MAWADASQRSEALPVARTVCDFTVSNRPTVSTSATAACGCRYQSFTAGGMIYDHVSFKSNHINPLLIQNAKNIVLLFRTTHRGSYGMARLQQLNDAVASNEAGTASN